MAATIKDLGKVTAYAYAKAAGYTGTEEQFQAIFNEFTENAPGLMDRMDTAVARAEAAVTDIDATVQDAVDDAVEEATASAVATANQAVSDAQAAQTAAEGAVTQANAAVTQANEAVTAAQAAQSAAEDAAESFVLDRTLTDSGAAAPADLVGDLKESFTQITSPSNNLINQDLIPGKITVNNNEYEVTKANGEFIGTSLAFNYVRSKLRAIPVNCEENTRYTLSFEAYTEQNESSTGNGMQVVFIYSDETESFVYVQNAFNQYHKFSTTSSANKTVVSIYFKYSSAANNIWHYKNFMLNEGTEAESYLEYLTAKDEIARNAISELKPVVDDVGPLIQYNNENENRLTTYINHIDMADIGEMVAGTAVKYDGKEIVGTAQNISAVFSNANLITPKIEIVPGKIYTLSLDLYTEGNASNTGNGLQIKMHYSNGIVGSTEYALNSYSEWKNIHKDTLNNADYVLDGIYIIYGSAATNIWHIKNIMLIEGKENRAYVPYLIPKDYESRDRLDDIEKVIPSFWDTEISQKIGVVNDNMGEAGIFGESFVFITDIHWAANFKYSPRLIAHIIKRTNIQFVICGGDNLVINTDKVASFNEGVEVIHALAEPDIRVYNTFGNHDANYRIVSGQTDATVHLDYGEVYASQFKEMEFNGIHYINPDVDFSYYFDHEVSKTRYIDLDTGEAGADDPILMNGFRSLSEVYDVLLSTPAGWNIVVIAHILMNNSDLTNLFKMLDANNAKEIITLDGNTYDLTNAKGTVKICIGGHHHKNYNWSTTGGIPCVVRDCDSYNSNYSTAKDGEIAISKTDTTGQSFDVVTIDYKNNMAHFVHIGTRCDGLDVALYSST